MKACKNGWRKKILIKEEIEGDLKRDGLTWSKKTLVSQWQPLKTIQKIERNGETM